MIISILITWLCVIWLTSSMALFWNFPLFCNFPLMICNFPLFSFFLKTFERHYYSNMKFTTFNCFDIRCYCCCWVCFFFLNEESVQVTVWRGLKKTFSADNENNKKSTNNWIKIYKQWDLYTPWEPVTMWLTRNHMFSFVKFRIN